MSAPALVPHSMVMASLETIMLSAHDDSTIDGGAVLELDQTEGAVFHLELGGIPGAHDVGRAADLGDLVEGGAEHGRGLVVVHHPQGQVEGMGGQVDQWAAALLLLVHEDAPDGHAAAPGGEGLGEVDLAEVARLAQRFFMNSESSRKRFW